MKKEEVQKRARHGGEERSGRVRHDFSVNLNPLGIPDAAKRALQSGWDICERYPDDTCSGLRKALGARFGFGPERVVCGNGASDLLYRLCLSSGFRRVMLPVPAFSEYMRALRASGCGIRMLPTREESGYVFDESMLDEIDEKDDALFLCNPSNPAGGLISGHLMRKIVKCCEEKGVLLVVDECFLDFVPAGGRHSAARYAAAGKNVVVLKAFTKIFAMAGLRLGFALFGSGQAADRVFCFGPPWQVSGPAQAAGLAVLNSPEESRAYLKETVRLIARERERMERELKNMGLIPVPGRANYILFRASPDLGRRLAERGFALRVCSDYEGLCPQERSPFQDNSILTEKTGHKREGGGCAAENVSPSVYYRAAVKNPQENGMLLREIGRCI